MANGGIPTAVKINTPDGKPQDFKTQDVFNVSGCPLIQAIPEIQVAPPIIAPYKPCETTPTPATTGKFYKIFYIKMVFSFFEPVYIV